MSNDLSPIALAQLARMGSTVSRRLAIVQEHAQRVFERRDEVDAWMAHYHPAILNGLCPVSLACQNPEGFLQTLAELGRIAERRERLGWRPPAEPPVEDRPPEA